ncbi:MAG: glycosyltransferase family 2 protein [Cyanobacteria bacterium J06560_6]
MSKVSVIIPAYNAMNYLPETVNSALSQSFVDFEIVIVNDGSTDDIEEWYDSLQNARVRLISQSNQGKSVALNQGLSRSTGEYIAFLDADDLWEPTKLEKQVSCLQANPRVGLVYTWTALADEMGQATGRVLASHAEGQVWETLLFKNILACGSTPMVRRQCFDVVGLFSPELPPAEDWDMWLRIAAHYDFAVLKEPLVRYRKHPGGISTSWQRMQASSSLALERAFQTAPADFSDIRDQAYGSLYLYLGWLAIKKNTPQQALHFWCKFQEKSRRILSWDAIRLRLTIFIVQQLGQSNYHHLRKLGYGLRRKASAILDSRCT